MAADFYLTSHFTLNNEDDVSSFYHADDGLLQHGCGFAYRLVSWFATCLIVALPSMSSGSASVLASRLVCQSHRGTARLVMNRLGMDANEDLAAHRQD